MKKQGDRAFPVALYRSHYLHNEIFQAKQIETKNSFLGIDAVFAGTNDMKEQKVIETLLSKREQISLATQVCILSFLMIQFSSQTKFSGSSHDSQN